MSKGSVSFSFKYFIQAVGVVVFSAIAGGAVFFFNFPFLVEHIEYSVP